jgi:hypothetical protein
MDGVVEEVEQAGVGFGIAQNAEKYFGKEQGLGAFEWVGKQPGERETESDLAQMVKLVSATAPHFRLYNSKRH